MNTMTPAQAEAMGDVVAKLMQVLFDASHAHPDMTLDQLAVAGLVALRGLAARERVRNPALTEEQTNTMLLHAMAMGLALPSDIVKVVQDGDTIGPDQAGFIPVRRH